MNGFWDLVRKDGRTDKSEFVGPNSAPRGDQKSFQTLLGQKMQEMLILSNFWPFIPNMISWKGT